MTSDEIESIAAECGNDNASTLPSDMAFLLIFAREIASREREACAQIVERNASACRAHSELHDILRANAAAIRARGDA